MVVLLTDWAKLRLALHEPMDSPKVRIQVDIPAEYAQFLDQAKQIMDLPKGEAVSAALALFIASIKDLRE